MAAANGVGQLRRRRSARERAHRHTRAHQFGDHGAISSAGGSRHEDGIHTRACHDCLGSVRRRARKLTVASC